MKHTLSIGLVSIFLLLAEEARSSNIGHEHDSYGGNNFNYDSEDEAAYSYLGKDSVVKFSPQEESIAKILKAFGSCQAKHPLSTDELAALKKQDTDMEYSHDAKCFFACMFKATDLLKDGRFVTENLAEYFDEDSSGIINSREIIEYCNKQVPESEPDLCEYVYKMTKCWTKKILNS
ncbi:unnamed protein product [Nezara viridula]|uniref:Odorant binding protein 11 n=1 Tax=Nezara viridula TaxID=85310 RepID=A0A4Y5RGI4_NEZVI|nr:odorant binding protein 11 [Nezara viridula]CAH1389325.1 unnamed protein product [Nezara viridula]